MEMTNTKINDINIKVGERTKVELEDNGGSTILVVVTNQILSGS